MKRVFWLIVLISFTSPSFSQVSLTLNTQIRYQKIEGFGGSVFYYCDWLIVHSRRQQIYDYLFKDLGATILRTGNHYYSETPSNPFMDKEASVIIEANKRTPTDVLLSAWSPAPIYKSNKSVYNYSTKATLATDSLGHFVYGPYAKWWYNSLIEYQKRGVSVKYMSIQNEPNWAPGYDACFFMPKEQLVYDDSLKKNVLVASYAQAFSQVYDTIDTYKSNLKVVPKMLGPELFGIEKTFSPNLVSYTSNMDMKKCYGLIHHLYTGGNAYFAQTYVNNMNYINTNYPNIPKFQTEYSNGNWFSTAGLIQNSLKYERVSGYLVWGYSYPGMTTSLVNMQNPFDSAHWTNKNGFTITKSFYALKHFCKYIRPGWQMVAISPSDSSLSSTAFISPDSAQVVIVLINNSKVKKTISIGTSVGFSIGTGTLYVTDSTQNFVNADAYNSSGTVLTPMSINTFVLDKAFPVPVTLSDFSVNLISSGKPLCKWKSELTADSRISFVVERSIDGVEFKQIGKVASMNGITDYSFTDTINSKLNLYYRIKTINPDNKSSYSNVVILKNNTDNRKFCIQPNPAHNRIIISGYGLKKVSISDVSGKVMFTKSLNADISENTINPTLSQGVYWINVMFEDGLSQVEKVVYFP